MVGQCQSSFEARNLRFFNIDQQALPRVVSAATINE